MLTNESQNRKDELKQLFEEVKANSATLEKCDLHDFSIVLDRSTKEPIQNPTPQQKFGARFKCTRCGGVVDGITRIWYDRGLAHGRKSK